MGVLGALMDKDDAGKENYKSAARAIYKPYLVGVINNKGETSDC